jgi:hypothetical protein
MLSRSPSLSLSQVFEPALETLMPLPPEAIYSSSTELYESIQAFARENDYCFRIGRSTRINNGPRQAITYTCDRCGQRPPEKHAEKTLQARKRRTSSRKTGCQFSINAIQVNDTTWELRHRSDPKFHHHNHQPSSSYTSHPTHRRLNLEEIEEMKQLHDAGNSP